MLDGQPTDIDDRTRAEALLAGERQLLEMVASGSPLPAVLDSLCRLVEGASPGCHCSVLVIDPGDARFQHGAAPSLPPSLADAIAGKSLLAPYWGPCAMAASEKTQVIVVDIVDMAVASRWQAQEWCRLVLESGLRSCWTTPILSREGNALGTFAIYESVPGSPTPRQQELIARFTHIASIAIEREHSEEALSRVRAELARATRATPADRAELAELLERYGSLGRREQEVMDLVVSGLLNKQIGAQLGISEITVKAHRGKVMRKMKADSLAHLVRMAARLDLPPVSRT